MFSYFIRRMLLMIPTFIGCTILVYTIMQLTPGGPFDTAIMQAQSAMATGEAGGAMGGGKQIQVPEEAKAELKRYYNLDKPIPIRYVLWLKNIVTGDFGNSYVFAEPVMHVITSRFPISIYFGLIGFLLSYLICIPLGIAKAIKHGSAFDVGSSVAIFVGYSIPGWALGAILLIYFGGKLGWVPLGEFRSPEWEYLSTWGKIKDQAHHTILPVFCYMVGGFATLTVIMKNSLLDNLGQDYVRTAFAKGLSEKRVFMVHALRNSLIPIATGIGGALGLILAGSFLIEKVFNIDGIGMLGFTAAVKRDYPVAMGILVINLVLLMAGNVLRDLLYAVIDPRIRFK